MPPSRRDHYQFLYGTTSGPEKLKEFDFPFFNQGDVEITLRGSRQYRLHSGILKSLSRTFRALLADEFTAQLSDRAKKKGAIMNRLIAVPNTDPAMYQCDVDLILVPLELDSDGKPVDAHPIGLDLENGRSVDLIYVAYEAVLGAFYNRPIELGNIENTSLSDMLEMALKVTLVAEYLEVVHVITKSFEAALLATGQVLQRSIANNPAAWLDFSYRIRSYAIFREALIHGAGQFNTPAMQEAMKTTMKKPVLAIVEKKGKMLMEGVKRTQMKILSYYPQYMQRELTVGYAEKDNIGRASYQNDIFSWIGLVAFRHFAAQNVADDKTHHAADLGFAHVSTINAGEDRYLDRSALSEFHRFFPMTQKGTKVVEDRITEIKEHVKGFVLPLLKNRSQLDTRTYAHKYFTCTDVQYHDCPWEARNKQIELSNDSDSDMASNEN